MTFITWNNLSHHLFFSPIVLWYLSEIAVLKHSTSSLCISWKSAKHIAALSAFEDHTPNFAGKEDFRFSFRPNAFPCAAMKCKPCLSVCRGLVFGKCMHNTSSVVQQTTTNDARPIPPPPPPPPLRYPGFSAYMYGHAHTRPQHFRSIRQLLVGHKEAA